MKKQLSCALLTISIFSLNILPAKAEISNIDNIKSINNQSDFTVMRNGQLCVEIPWMGLWCWYL